MPHGPAAFARKVAGTARAPRARIARAAQALRSGRLHGASDGHHRHGGRAHDLRRHAAEEEAPEPPAAVGPHDDHQRRDLGGRREDRLRGIAAPEQGPRRARLLRDLRERPDRRLLERGPRCARPSRPGARGARTRGDRGRGSGQSPRRASPRATGRRRSPSWRCPRTPPRPGSCCAPRPCLCHLSHACLATGVPPRGANGAWQRRRSLSRGARRRTRIPGRGGRAARRICIPQWVRR